MKSNKKQYDRKLSIQSNFVNEIKQSGKLSHLKIMKQCNLVKSH